MKTNCFIVLPDIHCDYEDPKFINISIKIIEELKASKASRLKGFVSLGDGLDFFQLSTYDKDPARKNTIGQDIEHYNKIIDRWSDAMPSGCDMHFLQGNHELRAERYIARQAKELHDIVPLLPTLLKFGERKKHHWHWHKYSNWRSLVIGNCALFHGFYFGKNVAMDALAKYKMSCIFGHVHRTQFIREGNIFAASLGHGSLEHKTQHTPAPTNWSQGIGVLTVLPSGKTELEIIHVDNGVACFRGKVIRG
jgi:hypothetical protein